MNKKDFSKYKFRASGIKYLMTNPRAKSEKLSQTTKSYLNEIWIEEIFGRKKPLVTSVMQKGTIVETDSMILVENVTGKTYFKNNENYNNEFITGTPDIVDTENKIIIDIKSPWDLWTFAKVDQKQAMNDYYWQIFSYMWLTGSEKGYLNYVLVNTPEMFVTDEIYKLSYKMKEEEAEKYRINYTFDDIDEKLRFKEYEFGFDKSDIEKLTERIQDCRNYLQELSL